MVTLQMIKGKLCLCIKSKVSSADKLRKVRKIPGTLLDKSRRFFGLKFTGMRQNPTTWENGSQRPSRLGELPSTIGSPENEDC